MLHITLTGGHEALIWGDEGLGAFMEARGCRAVPSNRPQVLHFNKLISLSALCHQEDPKRGDYYGGAKPDKIIYRYGSRNGAGQVQNNLRLNFVTHLILGGRHTS